MHRYTTALAVCATCLTTSFAAAQDIPPLETPQQKAAYALGVQFSANLREQAGDILDLDALLQGVKDGYSGAERRLTQEEIQAAFTVVQQQLQEVATAKAAEAAKVALEKGQAFLAQNASAEGVATTESGLQYRIETEGAGDSPTPEQSVTVHYEGRLLDGSVFDSSYARGEPATFPVTGVIAGWVEALQLMKPGAKWEVWIPSQLAYGPTGAGGGIGPNETLNFTIELIGIAE